MPFITLMSQRTNLPVQVRPDAITSIVHAEKSGAFVHVGYSGWAVFVTETPEQILAAIAEEAGAGDALLEEARDHLGAALKQALPEDDQILVGHMREAHALLRAALKARRP